MWTFALTGDVHGVGHSQGAAPRIRNHHRPRPGGDREIIGRVHVEKPIAVRVPLRALPVLLEHALGRCSPLPPLSLLSLLSLFVPLSPFACTYVRRSSHLPPEDGVTLLINKATSPLMDIRNAAARVTTTIPYPPYPYSAPRLGVFVRRVCIATGDADDDDGSTEYLVPVEELQFTERSVCTYTHPG